LVAWQIIDLDLEVDHWDEGSGCSGAHWGTTESSRRPRAQPWRLPHGAEIEGRRFLSAPTCLAVAVLL
jgi:hypothetical protein